MNDTFSRDAAGACIALASRHNPGMTSLDRRAFLSASAAAMTGTLLPAMSLPLRRDPLFRISLAQWSLHKELFAKTLDNLEFAKVARSLGFEAIEYVNTFFRARVGDAKYLAELKQRAADAGVQSLLIMCDALGDLGDADAGKRKAAVAAHEPWLDAAKFLGCHSIRVNAASSGSYEEQKQRAADGLRQLTELGAARDLNVIVENHGGLSSNGKWLAGVMALVDHPRCGTLPDFGNFKVQGDEWYDRYQGVAELMPFAKAVSAKSHDFDDDGSETKTDYARMLRIVVDAGYRGFVGVEYEGDRLSEREGIAATKRLLERVREEMEKERSKRK
jgi:sugar phosphate isomerase/epimerase